jgi:Tol biopolymer transport system component
MTSWDGTQHLRVTPADAEPRRDEPRWKVPRSRRAVRKTKGNQIWLLDRNGGEAQQFTDFKGRLGGYEWSPDSKKLLLSIGDPDPNSPEEGATGGGRGAGASAPAPKPIVIDRYKFKQDVQGYLTQPAARIYLFDIATKKLEVLTESRLEAAAPSFSPDGKMIAFMARSGKDADRYNTSNVFVMEARPGATRSSSPADGLTASASRGRPEWSPDGKMLTYLQSTGASRARTT